MYIQKTDKECKQNFFVQIFGSRIILEKVELKKNSISDKNFSFQHTINPPLEHLEFGVVCMLPDFGKGTKENCCPIPELKDYKIFNALNSLKVGDIVSYDKYASKIIKYSDFGKDHSLKDFLIIDIENILGVVFQEACIIS